MAHEEDPVASASPGDRQSPLRVTPQAAGRRTRHAFEHVAAGWSGASLQDRSRDPLHACRCRRATWLGPKVVLPSPWARSLRPAGRGSRPCPSLRLAGRRRPQPLAAPAQYVAIAVLVLFLYLRRMRSCPSAWARGTRAASAELATHSQAAGDSDVRPASSRAFDQQMKSPGVRFGR